MSKLTWDEVGERYYETGVSKGVIYPFKDGAYQTGVAWNGLTAVNESPSGAESSNLYADNDKYLDLISVEEFGATIEAYTYPDEFAECDGSIELYDGVYLTQQSRKSFGFTYQTRIGNDEVGDEFGYKIHLVYGCKAAPASKDNATVNDSPEAITLSWELSTNPIKIDDNFRSTAHIVIDSRKFTTTDGKQQLKALEDWLYGTETSEPKLPTTKDDFDEIFN